LEVRNKCFFDGIELDVVYEEQKFFRMKKVLITGGAGFIGSHLCDELLRYEYEVTVLDNLNEQVHGINCERPEYLSSKVHLVVGDIRDAEVVEKLVKKSDIIIHLAALVGVGQSMYKICEYTSVNNLGTAVLLEAIIKHPVKKLIVASSMSIYGEGVYQDPEGRAYENVSRTLEDLKIHQWDILNKGKILQPIGTSEHKTPDLSSIYALGKYDQERMCLMTGKAYNIPVTALRFFNVYGTRQALSNPYTGVLAIFSSRLLNNRPPLIFEDGNQQRDFIHVYDVAKACRLAMENDKANGEVFNIGSGNQYTVKELALTLAQSMGKENILPEITGEYRVGDIRHCFADINKAKDLLGFQPEITLKEGMKELIEWLKNQMAQDHVDKAKEELSSRGLTV
jgi:dTDP-L-rhamnose 4-epimerase